jgi:hypothetical protein
MTKKHYHGDQLFALSGSGCVRFEYVRDMSTAWSRFIRTARIASVKSVVPYRQCSAGEMWATAMETGGALSIGRFVVNPAGIWRDNCFMGIHCIAAILC